MEKKSLTILKRLGRLSLLIYFFCLAVSTVAFAVPPLKEMCGGLLVESGSSTQNIMPLLTKIARSREAHFKRIYGHHRGDYILVNMYSAGKIESVAELDAIADQVVHSVMAACPLSEGRLEIIRSPLDFWDLMIISFKNGKVISRELSPAVEAMQERIQLQKAKRDTSVGEVLAFDLISGKVNEKKICVSMTPKEVIKLMGKQAEDTSFYTYSYFKDGVEFAISEKSGNSYCSGITIFLQKYETIGGTYKPFKGLIKSLDKRERKGTIIEKFEEYKQFTLQDESSSTLSYSSPYGKLTFFFNENDGTINTVAIYINDK